MFDEIDTNNLFKHRSCNHAIEIKIKFIYFDLIFHLFVAKFEIFRKYLNDNFKVFLSYFLHRLQTHLSCSSKKNEDLRLCVNYKSLNFITIKNRYFVLLIEQLLNHLIEIAIFTKLNIRSTYNALRIRIDDEWKTVFRCKYEHFEYRVMSFELTNASANFQSYIYSTLRKYINLICIVYFDDILKHFSDKKIYKKYIRLVFETLRQFKLFANLKKCLFDFNEIDYLKYLMNTTKIKINFVKVQIFKIWFKLKFFKDI